MTWFFRRQLKKNADKVRLSALEKQSVRTELGNFISARPVRVHDALRHRSQLFLISRPMFATIAIALVLLLGGGTTLAAEGSIPGDLLYPVKVNVNEQVRAALATSAEAEAEWDARRTERRLEEAAVLAADGRLSATIETRISERFEKHTQRAQVRIEELEAAGKTEEAARLSSRLEVALKTHEQVLKGVVENKAEVKARVQPLLERMKERAEEHENIREKIEAGVEAEIDGQDVDAEARLKLAAEGHIKAADNKVTEVERFILAKKAELGAEATARAEAHLGQAEKVLVDAKAAFDADEFAKAFVLAGKAHRMAQEAKLFVHVKTELDIDVNVPGLLRLEGEARANVQASTTSRGEGSRVEVSGEETAEAEDRNEDRGGDKQDEREENESRGPGPGPILRDILR